MANYKPRSGFKTKICQCRPPSLSHCVDEHGMVDCIPQKEFCEIWDISRFMLYKLATTHKRFLATNRFKGIRYWAIIPGCEAQWEAYLFRNRNKRKPRKSSDIIEYHHGYGEPNRA